MVFTTAGGGANQLDTGYEIENSLRFNDDDSAYLTKTPSSTGNRRTWTFSCWFKLSNVGTDNFSLFTTKYVNGESTDIVVSLNKIEVYSVGTSGYDFQYATSQLFRDVSAWYHIVVAVDTTQGTDSNRVKIYINGSQVTSFSTTNHPNQNFDTFQNLSGEPTYIGASDVNVLSPAITRFFDGYLSEIYMIDGTQHAASDFGEYNDNGVWIPKNASGDLTFGTNGFYLEFKQLGTAADATSIGADTSGNDNHFSQINVTPAVDRTIDSPTNNFATFNPLDNDTITGAASFSEGNLVINANSDAQSGCPSTIAVSNGAWYIEGKCLSSTFEIGVFGYGDGFSFNLANHPPYGDNGYPFAYNYGGNLAINNSDTQTGLATFTTNDILAIALDMDNNTIKFFKNGSQVGTTITDSNLSTFAPYTFYVANHTGSNTNMFSLNTGNPAYTISSGNSDANGYGNFEYAVPSGYYALCTKNLAKYG